MQNTNAYLDLPGMCQVNNLQFLNLKTWKYTSGDSMIGFMKSQIDT